MKRRASARGTRKPPSRGRQFSAVDFPAMPDLHHEHHEHGIPNLIHDPVIPDAHAVEFAFALQLHASRRTGIFRKGGEGIAKAAQERRPMRCFRACRSNVTR